MFDTKEKMTALGPSVAPDGGQSKLCNESIVTENSMSDNASEEPGT